MAAINIPETAAVIIGSLGKSQRFISRKLGQGVSEFVITEAIVDLGRLRAKAPKEMEVIVGERNNGMNRINVSPIPHKSRVVRFGSKGPLNV